MPVNAHSQHNGRPTRYMVVPFILLMLALLALAVSLIGLQRTSAAASERLEQLQIVWEQVREGEVLGSELVAMDNSLRSVARPVPAIQASVKWSLGAALICLAVLLWLVVTARSQLQVAADAGTQAQNINKQALATLSDEITPLRHGDLRVQATVSDLSTGGVASTVNHTVSEMRWMVSTLGSSAQMIARSVENARHSAEHINAAFLNQSGHIHQSSNLLLSLSGTMAELSASASDTSDKVNATVEKADAGVSALNASLASLSSVGREVDGAIQKIHRLSENIRYLDERFLVIEEAAARVKSVSGKLSSNSSGDINTTTSADGEGLAPLFGEITQLQNTLNQVTRDYRSIRQTLALEAADSSKSLESIKQDIQDSSSQSSNARHYLDQIRADSSAMSMQALSLADRTVEHAASISKLTDKMNLINQIAQRTSEGVQRNDKFLAELNQLAGDLTQGLAQYSMPEQSEFNSSASIAAGRVRRSTRRATVHG